MLDHMLPRTQYTQPVLDNKRYPDAKMKIFFWDIIFCFSNFFFLGNIGKENVFYDILEWKNAFLRYKNKKSK